MTLAQLIDGLGARLIGSAEVEVRAVRDDSRQVSPGGVFGAVELRWPGHSEPASYTTPTPQLLHGALAKMRDAGCTHVVIEATSIAIVQERLAGLTFAVAAFSNLTQDHLDIHGTMDAY